MEDVNSSQRFVGCYFLSEYSDIFCLTEEKCSETPKLTEEKCSQHPKFTEEKCAKHRKKLGCTLEWTNRVVVFEYQKHNGGTIMKNNCIKKFKYMFSRFDFMGTEPQPKEYWEIGIDGTVEYFVIRPGSNERSAMKNWTVSKENVKEFFETIQDIIEKSDSSYEVEDDTIREVEITYQNNKAKVISAYTVEDSNGFDITVENEFRDFIKSVRNPKQEYEEILLTREQAIWLQEHWNDI